MAFHVDYELAYKAVSARPTERQRCARDRCKVTQPGEKSHDSCCEGKKLDGSSTHTQQHYVLLLISREGRERGRDDGRDTLNKRTKWAEVLMPTAAAAVVMRCAMCVCGLKSKEPPPTFLGSFPRHYVLSVAERMTGGNGPTLEH